MNQEIIDLYDEYTHKPLSREVFIQRLIALTGSITVATTVLSGLESCYTKPLSTANNNISTGYTYYDIEGGKMKAYIAQPTKKKKYGAVVVIHENRGLNPYIEDVSRRVAEGGFIAIAPDALSTLGGTPADADRAREMIGQLNPITTTKNFISAFEYASGLPASNGKFGCVGFCWGGALANQLAVKMPSLHAVVAFYGRQPLADDVPKIKAAVQLHYASLDARINEGIPDFEESLKKANVKYELYMYNGVNHAFHNNTSAARYNEEAAKLAWNRTLQFFDKHLQ